MVYVIKISKKCADVLSVIFQILVFVLLALIAISYKYKSILFKKPQYCIYIFLFIYVMYLTFEYYSSASVFLRNKTDEQRIKNLLSILVQTHPMVVFHCECYHLKKKRRAFHRHPPPKKGKSKANKSGNKRRRGKKREGSKISGVIDLSGRVFNKINNFANNVNQPEPEEFEFNKIRNEAYTRIVTWKEDCYLPYYSSRDVSGLFQLNKSEGQSKGKSYIKLTLVPEINFADEISYMDYEFFRTDFYNRNRPRDKYMDYCEERKVPGLNESNFVHISDEEPCGLSFCVFVFFSLFLLGEFYKCYFNSFCIDQEFKIRKLISTRYDLNMDQYQYFIPSINVPSQKYIFEEQNYNYLNNNYQVVKPTNQEIQNAEVYKDKIPKYKCTSYTSFEGKIKVGVVQDDPAYCSANYNENPPPNCNDVQYNEGQNNMNNNNNNINMQNNNDKESNSESNND
jgi:hypothetical protein